MKDQYHIIAAIVFVTITNLQTEGLQFQNWMLVCSTQPQISLELEIKLVIADY